MTGHRAVFQVCFFSMHSTKEGLIKDLSWYNIKVVTAKVKEGKFKMSFPMEIIFKPICGDIGYLVLCDFKFLLCLMSSKLKLIFLLMYFTTLVSSLCFAH